MGTRGDAAASGDSSNTNSQALRRMPSHSAASSTSSSGISSSYKRSFSAGSMERGPPTTTAGTTRAPEPEVEPVVIDTSSVDPEHVPCLDGVLHLLSEKLWHWKRFPIVLPEPVTQNNGRSTTLGGQNRKTLRLKDLFIQPNFNEVKSIAMDANGRPIKLNEVQLESLRLTGEFAVNSVQFPGQKHQWLVSQVLIKGKEKTLSSFHADLGRALYFIYCVAKDCIHDTQFSVFHGLNGWTQGLMSLLDMLFGVPLMDNVDLPQKLHEERSKYLVAELVCPNPEVLVRFKDYLSRIHGTGRVTWKDESPPPIPYQFQTPGGLEIDLRLFCADIIRSVQPHLLRILNAALHEWFVKRRHELVKSLQQEQRLQQQQQQQQQGEKDSKQENDELTKVANETLSREYLERVADAVMADPMILDFGPGIPELLVQQLRTSVIIHVIVDETREHLEQVSLEARVKLKEEHPVLSNISRWTSEGAEEARMKEAKKTEWSPHERAIEACKRLGLHQSAYFLGRDLAFRRDREPLLLRELRKLKQPSRTFKFTAFIWNPKNYIVKEKQEDGDYQVIKTVVCNDESGEGPSSSSSSSGKYLVMKERVYTSSTRYPCWRWYNFFLRTICWLGNAVFLFGVVIPWCSPVSFRALLCIDHFYTGYVVSDFNGRLVRDDAGRTNTVTSRLVSLWSHVRASRDSFESLPDTGLLSKSISRQFNRFVNYVLKGGIGTLTCLLVLPLLFLTCSILSLALALTAVVWVPTFSALLHVLALIFYDVDGVNAFNAVLWNVVFNFLLHGILMPLAAGTVALVVCPVTTSVLVAAAFVRRTFRDAWDGLMFTLFLKKRARVPSQNNFLAKRIAGPGLASEYFYQIKPEQALVALETRMELAEIEVFENVTVKKIREPLDNYNKWMRSLFSPFGLTTSGQVNNGPCQVIERETEKLIANLNEKTARRRQSLESQLSSSVTSKVRLLDTDLRMVLSNSVAMVKDFFPPRVFSLLSQKERVLFWEKRNLLTDDWLGLSCSLLTEFFSEGFLTPLQDTDTYFNLQVKEWNLSQYMNMVMESSWRDDLDLAQVMYSQPICRGIRQPEILVEYFNPDCAGCPVTGTSSWPFRSRSSMRFRQRLFSDRWYLYRRGQREFWSSSTTTRLTTPVPVPHPVDITLVILQRDCPNESGLASESVKNRATLLKDKNLPLADCVMAGSRSSVAQSLLCQGEPAQLQEEEREGEEEEGQKSQSYVCEMETVTREKK